MEMSEALVHMRISLLPLWLEFSLFLSGWPQIGQFQDHSPPEVVIPLRVTGTSRGMVASGWISYSLHFGGQKHIVHMKAKKHLVSRTLTVFTYTDQGALLEDQPFIQNDCYYHGYVEGDPESMVTLSTCLGSFQGILKMNGIAYEIKPKRLSATFEHLIYKMDREDTKYPAMRCRLTEEQIAEQLKFHENDNSILLQSSYTEWWLHHWFLELAVVVDHGRFIFRKRNVSVVEMDVVMGINLVDDIYSLIGLNVVLIAIEVWNTRNHYTVASTHDMMVQFCRWKKYGFNKRVSHDAAHIIVKQDFCNDTLTMTYFSGICNLYKNCGVECIMDDDLASFRTYVTHEIGHALGMMNDDGRYCTCGENTCIMNENLVPSEAFSNCSYNDFLQTTLKKTCLHNIPNSEDIITKKRCGNGVVEDGEECDCGSIKLCAKDVCCSEDCTLVSGAECASGLCCENCQFMLPGTECRKPINQCDLPEWCNGTSSECPEDMYVEDGTQCLGNGICFQKRCNDRNDQCRHLFGEGAKNANQKCYLAMNTKGDRFGHCGMDDTRYIRCQQSDVLCGRVQCENVTEIPHLQSHTTVLSAHVDGYNCWSTDYHFGMNIPDIGDVKDGTECGPGLMCLKRKCVTLPSWEESCMPMFCNKRGVCNNKHHCHCNEDWDPPNCLNRGNGGSVDSGPAPDKKSHKLFFLMFLIWIFAFLSTSFCLLGLLYIENTKYEQRRRNIKHLPKKEQTVLSAEKPAGIEFEEQVENVEKPSSIKEDDFETLSRKSRRSTVVSRDSQISSRSTRASVKK